MQVSKFVRSFCGAIAFAFVLGAPNAGAFELFGYHLFGEKKENLDADGRPTLKYAVRFDLTPKNSAVEDQLKSASTLHNLIDRGTRDNAGLKARAEADLPRMIASLYAQGYYGGTAEISIAGRPLASVDPGSKLAPSNGPVQVVIKVATGNPFVFGKVEIIQPTNAENTPTNASQAYGIVPGEPALSGNVLDAEERIVKAWRAKGYPLAKIGSRNVQANHASRKLNVTLSVEPRRRATFGAISVNGTKHMDPDFVTRQTGLVPGAPYSPAAIEDAKEQLTRLEVFENVRVTEAESLTPGAQLPLAVDVSERKRRIVGANAGWSSVDGGEVEAYWAHRNLFGRAERLRVDAAVAQFGEVPVNELKYKAGVSFAKPGVLDIDTDFFADQVFLRERPDTYESKSATTRAGLTHRFNKQISGSLAGEFQISETEDAFGVQQFTLLGIPATVTYDSRDDLLDPSRGLRSVVLIEPFYDLRNDNAFVLGRLDLSAYQKFDESGRFVVAGRFAAGTFVGAGLDEIPADRRFFAGGGGSIRGYAYRNVGPRQGDEVLGGRSLVETSLEFRARVTETIGIVPFVDAGLVSEDSYPGSDVEFQVGVGVGLRYYTAIGPIRFDLAVPLDPQDNDPDFAFYAGLGQVF